MNFNTIKLLRIIPTFVLAVLFISTSVLSYWGWFENFYYMTFLGNFITGIFMLVVSILYICKKEVPQYFILAFTVLMLLILGIVIATQDSEIDDGFLFLHFLNPIFMFMYYLLFSNQTKVRWQLVLITLAMPFAYMIFAFILGTCTGDYIYYYLDYNDFGILNTIIFIMCTLIGLLIISYGIYFLNRSIQKSSIFSKLSSDEEKANYV